MKTLAFYSLNNFDPKHGFQIFEFIELCQSKEPTDWIVMNNSGKPPKDFPDPQKETHRIMSFKDCYDFKQRSERYSAVFILGFPDLEDENVKRCYDILMSHSFCKILSFEKELNLGESNRFDFSTFDFNSFWKMFSEEKIPDILPQKFSIAVTNFNYEKYLRQSLMSILDAAIHNGSSGIFDIDVCIVDDCSTDGSRILLESFQRKAGSVFPVKVIYNDRNLGTAASRNLAIQNTSNPWIVYLDSDDWFVRSILYKLSKSIQDNPECSMFQYGDRLYLEDEKRFQYKLPYHTLGMDIYSFMVNDNMGNYCYHRSVFEEQNGYDLSMKTHEDLMFCLRGVSKFKAFRTSDNLINWRIRKPSRHTTGFFSNLEANLPKVASKFFQEIPETVSSGMTICGYHVYPQDFIPNPIDGKISWPGISKGMRGRPWIERYRRLS